ncbi:hypothetical protein [Mycolicibacterium llatzerense]|uniref:Uncharacterized protein n=1 Tax=Mycolicibacterium llatzerense TaxID=280871 RepID=A0A0D1LEX3_9MYCO|nr:hypothetical protein TL10_24220 [Mycolicibacterium llatzerense]
MKADHDHGSNHGHGRTDHSHGVSVDANRWWLPLALWLIVGFMLVAAVDIYASRTVLPLALVHCADAHGPVHRDELHLR